MDLRKLKWSYAIGSECLERFSAKFRCGRVNRCREMAFVTTWCYAVCICCASLCPSVRFKLALHMTHFEFRCLQLYLLKFNMQVDYIKRYPCHDKLPCNGRGYGHGMVMVTWPFFNFGLQSCLWNQWSLAFQILCPDWYRGVLEHAW